MKEGEDIAFEGSPMLHSYCSFELAKEPIFDDREEEGGAKSANFHNLNHRIKFRN